MTVHSFDELELEENWWPEALRWHSSEGVANNGRIKLALVEDFDDSLKHRHVYAALGDPDDATRLVSALGFKGHDPDSNGPHPSADVGGYAPRFWVFTDGTVTFEPLAIRWDSGGNEVILPDQGLLMTYGLVPRFTQDQIAHWDDQRGPEYDMIVADSVSSSIWGQPGRACVETAETLAQDYCSLRGMSIVQVYFVQAPGEVGHDGIEEIVKTTRQVDVELPGRSISLKRLRDGRILAQCWGIRRVLEPGPMPLTDGRWDYEDLEWPGFGLVSSVSPRSGVGGHASKVFVRDTVLARFEGQRDIEIHPDSGAFSYRNQWGVSWCERYGRDLIEVDLKKLYEGSRPEIVAHYSEHAVEPPSLDDRGWDDPNVGSRAARIAQSWAELGEALATLAQALGIELDSNDLVGVDRGELAYRGWWSDAEFEVIGRHIPPGLSADAFLQRCEAIHRSTVDRLKEGNLRRMVHELGFDRNEVRERRSLKLLELILRAASVANESGLDIVEDREEIVRQVDSGNFELLSPLFKVNDLRQLVSHAQTAHDTRAGEILIELGIDPRSAAGGYDYVLDEIYDLVGDALENAAECLFEALEG